MAPYTAVFLLVALAIGASQGFLVKPKPDLSTGHEFLTGLKTVANDLKESVGHKKQAIADTAAAILNAKLSVVRNVKDAKANVVSKVVGTKVSKLQSIKSAKQKLLSSLVEKLRVLFNKEKIQESSPETSQPSSSHPKIQFLHETIKNHPLYRLLVAAFSKLPKLPGHGDPTSDHVELNGVKYVFVPLPKHVPTYGAPDEPLEEGDAYYQPPMHESVRFSPEEEEAQDSFGTPSPRSLK